MATVALWHLGVTAVLAGVLSGVMLLQSLCDVFRRHLRRGGRRVLTIPAPRQTVEAGTVVVGDVAVGDPSRAMASAGGTS